MFRTASAFSTVIALVAMLLGGTIGVAAQDATPTSATFTDTMGLPELSVTVTDSAYEGLPAETPAGRYVLNIDIAAAEGGGISFMQLPDGLSLDDLMALLAAPPEGSPEAAAASPIAGDEAAAEGGDAEDGPPDWYFTTRHAGGTAGGPGQLVQAIVDLTPGTWVAWGDDPEAAQPPVGLTVTEGIDPATAPEPAAAATMRMFEFGFEVEGTLVAGPQTLRVTNAGAQPHFLIMDLIPEGTTKEQIEQLLELDMTGATPTTDSGLPNPDTDFVPVAFTATLSTGTSMWIATDLPAGTYVAVCFFPDIASGEPHAYKGMYEIFTVA